MIALHLRDSPLHLIAASQQTGFGIPVSFGGSSFHGRAPLRFMKTVTLNLRDLYRVRCYSFVYALHNKVVAKRCQQHFVHLHKNNPISFDILQLLNKVAVRGMLWRQKRIK